MSYNQLPYPNQVFANIHTYLNIPSANEKISLGRNKKRASLANNSIRVGMYVKGNMPHIYVCMHLWECVSMYVVIIYELYINFLIKRKFNAKPLMFVCL